jgi:hypothetical protein
VTCRPTARKRVDKRVSMGEGNTSLSGEHVPIEMESWKPACRCVMDVSFDTDVIYKRREELRSDQ